MHSMSHVFPVVSVTDEHYLIFHSFHLHSATFCSTIYQTSIDVIFTRRLYVRRFINVSFGPVPDSTSPTGYEPKNLIEGNSMKIKPMLFHRPSMTSTCDTSESIATPSPESDLDDDQIRICQLHRCTCRRDKQVLTDHEFITLFRETQCPVHLLSEKVQGNVPRCSHIKESRVKTHFPTKTAFLQDIKQFRENVNLSSGSLIRKKLREQFLKYNEIINSQKRNLKS